MAKRRYSGTYTMYVKRHNIIWWLLIGWWYRPIKTFFVVGKATMLGYAHVKKVVLPKK